MPVSATAIRALQRALLDVCVQQIEDVAEAVELWQRLDQVLADELTGRAVAATEAAGVTRPVADDAARRAVPFPVEQSLKPGRAAPVQVDLPAPGPDEAAATAGEEAAGTSSGHQPEPEPEPAPEPPLVITDEPRPPATPRLPPPKAKPAAAAAPVGDRRAWTVDEVHRMQRWRDEGKEWSWIAEALGRTKASCQVKMDTIKRRPAQRPAARCSRRSS